MVKKNIRLLWFCLKKEEVAYDHMMEMFNVFILLTVAVGCFSLPFSLRELETILQNRRELERRNGECHVVGYNASCCQHIEVDQVKLNSTVCVNVSYLPSDYGLSLTVTLDGKVYINETVSARNPPALCAQLPYLKKLASICLKLYNLDISHSTFSGCAKIIIRLVDITIADEDVGCFKFPSRGHSSMKTNQKEVYVLI